MPGVYMTDDRVWGAWVTNSSTLQPYVGNAWTTQATGDTIWRDWVIQVQVNTTIPSALSVERTWNQWMTVNASSLAYTPQLITSLPPEPLTPEQQAQVDRDRAEHARRETARRNRKAAATARAMALLGEFLDDMQKEELERHGQFHVTGSRGRRYCIRAGGGQSGNVSLLHPRGTEAARLCVHPTYPEGSSELLPAPDGWLAQMLHIQTDEDQFLRTANIVSGALPAEIARPRGQMGVPMLVP